MDEAAARRPHGVLDALNVLKVNNYGSARALGTHAGGFAIVATLPG
ncbi:MAG TPA: hypothetical protein VME20_03590 [Acidimicrobiales bacterium]|nr:hypothetical protein [Acidimicrobiales bacterium]